MIRDNRSLAAWRVFQVRDVQDGGEQAADGIVSGLFAQRFVQVVTQGLLEFLAGQSGRTGIAVGTSGSAFVVFGTYIGQSLSVVEVMPGREPKAYKKDSAG